MRLPLVEDERDIAETLTWGLGAEGYVVDTADNGAAGLWKAPENAYLAKPFPAGFTLDRIIECPSPMSIIEATLL